MSRGVVERAVRAFLGRHAFDERPLSVACSGGADSLALALGCLAVVGPDRVSAVTIDHGLQPGSADQAAVVVSKLRDNGFRAVSVVRVNVGQVGGPEAAARTARYAALTPEPIDRTVVLLGHTLDDQAETVLLGLARGSGPRSIAGMSDWRPPFGRPLLGLRRTDTEAACRDHGVSWWTDPHNADPRFTRVRLRTQVLPLLEDVLGGGVAGALARTADLLGDDLRALDQIAAEEFSRRSDLAGHLDLSGFVDHPPAVRRRVLRAWASASGIRELTADQLYRLDRLATDRPRAAVRLPGDRDAVRDGLRLTWAPVDL